MVTQPKYYGLNVSRILNDLSSKSQAIENLGLNIKDLETINGMAAEGVRREDLQTLSGNTRFIQKYTTQLTKDVEQYNSIFDNSAGAGQIVQGNITINGKLGGSSIKYRYLDGGNILQYADISTSRVSSWSSSDSPPSNTSPIFFGGELKVNTTVDIKELEILTDAEPIIFPDSEVPTHRIQASIGETTVYLYAMKNIPLVFDAFFRNAELTVGLASAGSVSWRILALDNDIFTLEYENIGTGTITSRIFPSDTNARSRKIEIYHNPDNIKEISLPSAGISTLPNAQLTALRSLDLSNNLLVDFPDITTFSSGLTSLNLSKNNFRNSNFSDRRSFNSTVLGLIPIDIQELYLATTFSGDITADLTTLTKLRVFDISNDPQSITQLKFSGALPEVADTVTVYKASYNQFITIPNSIQSLPNLEELDISNNDIIDTDFSLSSPALKRLNISANPSIKMPNLSGRSGLISVTATTLPNTDLSGTNLYGLVDSDGQTYKFSNCSSLDTINLSSSNYNGPIPKFSGNSSLRIFDALNCRLQGGRSFEDDDYVLYEDTFEDCAATIQRFRLTSSNLINKPIHPNTFLNTTDMRFLQISSGQRGVSGSIPTLTSMSRLSLLALYGNNLTGTLPSSISANPSLVYISFNNNQLTGSVPEYESNTLRRFYCANNDLSSFSGLNTPNILDIFLNNNSLSGSIPDFSKPGLPLTQLQRLSLNNNNFTGYTSGSLTATTALTSADFSNNSLTEGSINNIINDLYENYQLKPRSGVSINIENNATPTGTALEQISFLVNNGWNIRR